MELAVPAGPVGPAELRTGKFVPTRIVIIMISIGPRGPDHLGHGVGQHPEALLARRQISFGGILPSPMRQHDPSGLQPPHRGFRQDGEALTLNVGQPSARFGRNDTQRPQRLATLGYKRRPGIKANMRFAGDERIILKTSVLRRVAYVHDIMAQHCVRAERHAPGRLGGVDPGLRHEPLAMLFNQADQRDGAIAKLAGKLDDPGQFLVTEQPVDLIGLKRDALFGRNSAEVALSARHGRSQSGLGRHKAARLKRANM
ncbi:hypothetical protein M2346_000392 [Sphingobium xanthum]|nr:hypothetical protein [Sphingobium sp. B10D3B]MCW2400373.1 hypothetical protein [Sphingobium sp. B10D7B]MCW2407351.1 hypothetical protein [Sphingobium xanthum]